MQKALLALHRVAEVGERGGHLLGVGPFDDRLGVGVRAAEGADLVLDLAYRVAGDGRQHDRTAKGDATGVVVGVVERRRQARSAFDEIDRHIRPRGGKIGWLRESFHVCLNETLSLANVRPRLPGTTGAGLRYSALTGD